MNANKLAAEFSRNLRQQLGDSLAIVVERNRQQPDPGICHSHDFVDANVVMLEAWENLEAIDVDDIIHDDAKRATWCEAWDIAKRAEFSLN